MDDYRNSFDTNDFDYYRKPVKKRRHRGTRFLAVFLVLVIICLGVRYTEPGRQALQFLKERITGTDPQGEDGQEAAVSSSETTGSGGNETPAVTSETEENPIDQKIREEGILPAAGKYGAASAEVGYYCYEQLTDAEKTLYDRMLYAMENRCTARIEVEEASEDAIDRIFTCVCYDHPEVFDVSGYRLGKKQSRVTGEIHYEFEANYLYDVDTWNSLRGQIDQICASVLAGVDPSADQYTRAKFVYDYIIGSTDYDSSADQNQTMVSVFLDGRSVCAGYSAATQYLLQKLGIRCGIVSGSVIENDVAVSHAWNILMLDGQYYYMDTTYGDPVLEGESSYDFGPDYDYFCVTTQDISVDHVIDESKLAAPVCTAVDDNYYHREGKYFVTYDTDQLTRLFESMEANGEKTLSIRCADEGLYQEMKTNLIDNYGVFDYIPDTEEHGYRTNDDLYTIEIAVQ